MRGFHEWSDARREGFTNGATSGLANPLSAAPFGMQFSLVIIIPPSLRPLSFEDGVVDIARIPPKWMCDIHLTFGGESGGGRKDAERCRIEVMGRGMTMGALVDEVEERVGRLVMDVYLDGVKWGDMEATVEKAKLFECKKVAAKLTSAG